MIYRKGGEHANYYPIDAVLQDKGIGLLFIEQFFIQQCSPKSGCLILVQDELNTQSRNKVTLLVVLFYGA